MAIDDLGSRAKSPSPQIARITTKRNLMFALLLAAALTLVIAPVAQAATATYAAGIASDEWQYRYTGPRTTVTGGANTISSFAGDGALPIAHIETYRPAPGYQTVGYGNGGGEVYMSHARANTVQQKCAWDWPWSTGSIGKLNLTCKVYY